MSNQHGSPQHSIIALYTQLANAERVSLTHYKTSAATTGAIFKASKD